MDELKKFTNWWSLMAAAGVAILIAAINQQNPAGMYFGAGLLLGGIGEWICRPTRTEVVRGAVPGQMIKHTSNPWRPKPLGIGFDVVGIAAVARAIYLVSMVASH